MTKMRFVEDKSNLQANGFVLNCEYDVTNERDHKSGHKIVTVSGPGLETPATMYSANIPLNFIAVVVPAVSASQTQEQVYVQKETPKEIVHTNDLLKFPIDFIILEKKVDDLIAKVLALGTSTKQQETGKEDILLAGLAKMEFTFMNLKLTKTNGAIAMTIVVDGIGHGLSINDNNIAASNVLQQILDAFGQNVMITASINAYNKELQDIKEKTEKELKKAKNALTKATAEPKPSASAKEDNAPASVAPTTEGALFNDQLDQAPLDDDIIEEDGPDGDFVPVNVPPLEPVANSGISQQVEDFKLI
jgi:hypothetical protein